MNIGHWNFDSNFNVDDWFGFIYRIVEKNTGKEYIGKKQFFSKNRKIVKGRKNRKVILKESNWKTYTGSSDYLQARISEFGLENFDFFIESLQPTKGALSYAEIELQVTEDVLRAKLPNGERKYYNKSIGNIKFTPPDKVSSKTRAKISSSSSGENHDF